MDVTTTLVTLMYTMIQAIDILLLVVSRQVLVVFLISLFASVDGASSLAVERLEFRRLHMAITHSP